VSKSVGAIPRLSAKSVFFSPLEVSFDYDSLKKVGAARGSAVASSICGAMPNFCLLPRQMATRRAVIGGTR